jgi:hypothetical protein
MPLFASHTVLRRFSGCGVVPTAWQGHPTASVACASLSLHRSSLRLGQDVSRNSRVRVASAPVLGPGTRDSGVTVLSGPGLGWSETAGDTEPSQRHEQAPPGPVTAVEERGYP